MNAIGQDGKGKNIIKKCKVPGKFKEDNSSNICKKWRCVELNCMLKNLFPLRMQKEKFNKNIRKLEKGAPSHTMQRKLQYNMYEESIFKKKVFDNNYNATLSIKHNVNTYSMQKKYFII